MYIIINKDENLEYDIIRKNVKNTTIRIKPDGRIEVTTNKRVTNDYIETFILKKIEWIQKIQKSVKEKNKLYMDTDYLCKNELWLLGKKYTFKIIDLQYGIKNMTWNEDKDKIGDPIVNHSEASNEVRNILVRRKISITLEDNTIVIRTHGLYVYEEINKKIEEWLSQITRDAIMDSVERIYPLFQSGTIPYPEVKIRKMNTRWGTCKTNSNIITINQLLIHLPIKLIDYVVAHELSHFIYGDHSKNFYNLLALIMPEHKVLQNSLKNYVIIKDISK